MSILLGSVSVNPNSTGGAHTKSSWQTIATPSQDLYGITIVCVQNGSNGGTSAFDVGYGATPTVLAQNIPANSSSTMGWTRTVDCLFPSGQAVKFRIQYENANSATITYYFYGHTEAGNRSMASSMAALNFDTATTSATATLTGNTTTANTEGSWVEIASSTSGTIHGIWVHPLTNNVTYAGLYLVDVTTGGSGSETTPPTIGENVATRRVSGSTFAHQAIRMTCNVAAGTRIAARLQADTTAAGSRDLPVVFVASYGTISSSSTTLIGDDMVNTETYARGAASKIVTVFIRDTTGAPKTGLAYNTGSFTCYKKVGSGSGGGTAVSLADMTLGTYTANGFKEIDATNMPGLYQYCPATLDASADQEVHTFKLSGTITQTNFVIKLTGGDPRAATVEIGSTSKTAIANEVVEAEITALKSYNRSADTTATITGPTSGSTSLGVTTDATYKPIKTF